MELKEIVSKYDLPKGKYMVSPEGKVFVKGKECKYHKMAKGGYFVRLSGKGVDTSMTRAKIVLMTFKGLPPSSKHKAHHRDGDVFNDHVDNLAWATEKEISKFRMQNPDNYKRIQALGRSNKGKPRKGRGNTRLSTAERDYVVHALSKGLPEEKILMAIGNKIKTLNHIKYAPDVKAKLGLGKK